MSEKIEKTLMADYTSEKKDFNINVKSNNGDLKKNKKKEGKEPLLN